MNTQKFEAPSGINLYNNINTWINEISVKCPGMTSQQLKNQKQQKNFRTQQIIGMLINTKYINST